MREEEENKSYIICSSCDVRIVGTLLSAIKRIELKTALLGRPPGKLSTLFFISLHENMALPATMLPVELLHLWCSKVLECRALPDITSHTTYRKNNNIEKCAGIGLNGFQIR